MLRIDDSIHEYALYDVLHAERVEVGESISLDRLRSGWRRTGLRHADLYTAIDLLQTAESLIPVASDVWTLSRAGSLRVGDVASVSSPTMADQVARSVLKRLQEQVPMAGRVARSAVIRRNAAHRIRQRTLGGKTSG